MNRTTALVMLGGAALSVAGAAACYAYLRGWLASDGSCWTQQPASEPPYQKHVEAQQAAEKAEQQQRGSFNGDKLEPSSVAAAPAAAAAADDRAAVADQQAASWLSTAASEPLLEPSSSGALTSSTPAPPARRSINTTVHHPPLDTANSSSVLAASLQLHYPQGMDSSSLAYQCSVLCERHCPQLQDFTGELGDTIALDLACGAGGTSFGLAQSFSHVLGIDGDPMLVLAAKELKERGHLQYQATDSSGNMVTCTARVGEDIDRDRVRFWHYKLPALPPKLQPLDAVLLADVQQRMPHLLQLLEAVPFLLKPQGVCVVVLPDTSQGPDAPSADDVAACMEGQGLRLLRKHQFQYAAVAGAPHGSALATVWQRQ